MLDPKDPLGAEVPQLRLTASDKKTAMTVIRNQLNNFYWRVTAVDYAAHLLGLGRLRGPAYEKLKAVHLYPYTSMSEETREELSDLIIECLHLEPNTNLLVEPDKESKVSFFTSTVVMTILISASVLGLLLLAYMALNGHL